MIWLQVWLKQPLVTLEDIVGRHDVVEAFVSDPQLREGLRNQQLRGRLCRCLHFSGFGMYVRKILHWV